MKFFDAFNIKFLFVLKEVLGIAGRLFPFIFCVFLVLYTFSSLVRLIRWHFIFRKDDKED